MSSEGQQDSFDATKRTTFNSHSMSDVQERPRLPEQPRFNGGLNCRNFGFLDGERNPSDSNNVNNTRDRENGEAI